MDLQQLKYFQTIARLEHVSRAAEELYVAQPSLSRAIARLEEELGVPLFDRQGRHIQLNHLGRAFLKYVEEAFDKLEEGKREVEDLASFGAGTSWAWCSLHRLHTVATRTPRSISQGPSINSLQSASEFCAFNDQKACRRGD